MEVKVARSDHAPKNLAMFNFHASTLTVELYVCLLTHLYISLFSILIPVQKTASGILP